MNRIPTLKRLAKENKLAPISQYRAAAKENLSDAVAGKKYFSFFKKIAPVTTGASLIGSTLASGKRGIVPGVFVGLASAGALSGIANAVTARDAKNIIKSKYYKSYISNVAKNIRRKHINA